MDVFSIDYSQKPDNPSGGIIGFTGGILYARYSFLYQEMSGYTVFRQGGAVSRVAQGQ